MRFEKSPYQPYHFPKLYPIFFVRGTLGKRARRRGVACLAKLGKRRYLERKKGGKCVTTYRPVWGTSPEFRESSFSAP